LRTALVVGEPGLVATLREGGVDVLNAGDDGLVTADLVHPEAVVVGIHRTFHYGMMNSAMQALLLGARFVATNRDSTFPLEGGRLTPGAGSIVAGIATCGGKEPYVVGKPNPFLIELALKEMELSPADLLVVGDRDDTDLESGRRAGCPTHLVLTGVGKAGAHGQSVSEDLRALL
jgi:4-nitrophenyl phosphatase